MEGQKNNQWLKIGGWIVGGVLLAAGWVYAGIVSSYTLRIVKLEAIAEMNRADVRALQLQQARFEEMFKALNDKLDILIDGTGKANGRTKSN